MESCQGIFRISDFQDLDNKQVTIKQIASLYCEVWKEAPWYEDFWKLDEVIQDIENVLSRKILSFIVAFDIVSDQVIGFCWGYDMSLDEYRGFSGNNIFPFKIVEGENFSYFSEIAVEKSWRKKSVASVIGLKYLDQIGDNKKIILRTDKKAVAARKLFRKLGFVESETKDAKHTSRSYWYR